LEKKKINKQNQESISKNQIFTWIRLNQCPWHYPSQESNYNKEVNKLKMKVKRFYDW